MTLTLVGTPDPDPQPARTSEELRLLDLDRCVDELAAQVQQLGGVAGTVRAQLTTATASITAGWSNQVSTSTSTFRHLGFR